MTNTEYPYRIILVALAVRGPVDEALAQVDAILDAGAIQYDLENYAGCEVLASACTAIEKPADATDLIKEVTEAAGDWGDDTPERAVAQ